MTTKRTLRECAERIVNGYREVCTMTPHAPYVPEDSSDNAVRLAVAYLAEHHADDETAIDEAWLLASGGTNARIRGCGRVILFRLPTMSGDAQWVEWDSMSEFVSLCRRSDEMDEHELPPDIVTTKIKTRGPFRVLARVLGIELKEPAA